MNKIGIPLSLNLNPDAFNSMQGTKHMLRYLSDIACVFRNQQAVDEILTSSDPLIYEHWEISNENSLLALNFGITRILPGTIGQEYHMTKGHFHTIEEDGDELYLTLQGQGLLLLQTRTGESQALKMIPGNLCYVPAGWGHRSVNCGDEELVFASIWLGTVGHDYHIVERGGFPQLATKGSKGPIVIENPQFLDYEAAKESMSE